MFILIIPGCIFCVFIWKKNMINVVIFLNIVGITLISTFTLLILGVNV